MFNVTLKYLLLLTKLNVQAESGTLQEISGILFLFVL